MYIISFSALFDNTATREIHVVPPEGMSAFFRCDGTYRRASLHN